MAARFHKGQAGAGRCFLWKTAKNRAAPSLPPGGRQNGRRPALGSEKAAAK